VTIQLADYVRDLNDTWSSLDIGFSAISAIQIHLDSTGALTIKPDPDWFGTVSVPFQVTDPLGERAAGSIDIQVISVSDPPLAFSLISPRQDTTFASETPSYPFRWQPAENVDPDDQIRYRFFLSTDSLFHSPKAIRLSNLQISEISLNQTLEPGVYFWAVMAEDQEGLRQWSEEHYRFHVQEVSGIQSDPAVSFQLGRNRPNPFNHSTVIVFQLDRAVDVILNIVDVRGAIVRSLIHRRFDPGQHQVRWDGRNEAGHLIPSGVYWATLKASDRILTIKICLVK
jgi:hypothetical protein